jgi:hypothetical protein
MQKESHEFTAADVPRFFDELIAEDARATAARLRAASARMRELAALVPDVTSQEAAWNAKEILAHMAVLSRAYGVFAAMIAKGRLPELKLADVITQRDAFGEAMAQRSIPEIVEEAAGQHQRTLAFLETATPAMLEAECRTEHGVVTPERLIRLPLVAHMEQHLRQLEEALGAPAGQPATAGVG